MQTKRWTKRCVWTILNSGILLEESSRDRGKVISISDGRSLARQLNKAEEAPLSCFLSRRSICYSEYWIPWDLLHFRCMFALVERFVHASCARIGFLPLKAALRFSVHAATLRTAMFYAADRTTLELSGQEFRVKRTSKVGVCRSRTCGCKPVRPTIRLAFELIQRAADPGEFQSGYDVPRRSYKSPCKISCNTSRR